MYLERLRAVALDHLGGTPDRHDVAVFDRMTFATLAAQFILVKLGDTVIGVSASHSHPSVVRAANHVGARFIDTTGLARFEQAMTAKQNVALVDLTRLAVTYDLMPVDDIRGIVAIRASQGRARRPETLARFGRAAKYVATIDARSPVSARCCATRKRSGHFSSAIRNPLTPWVALDFQPVAGKCLG